MTLDRLVGQRPGGQLRDLQLDVVDRLDFEVLAGDVTETSGQPEDQRRQREDREERPLGRESGDPVAQADPDGLRDQLPDRRGDFADPCQ
jgi:hypothetical protein